MITGFRRCAGDIAALGGLALLSLAFFWKIALTNQVLAGVDLFAYFYPYRDFASAALGAGRLPLWNPHLFMGAPLLANSQVAVLYPLHWPLAGLEAPKQVAWSIVVHIWLAGAGMYLFARQALNIRPWAASLSAVVFALGGFLSAQVEHINQLNASAWLPWLLLCQEMATHPGRGRRLALFCGAAVVALILLAGHTQAAYIVFAAAAVYAACVGLVQARSLRGWGRLDGLRGLAVLAIMGIAGLLLALGQLLPTLELSTLSIRSGGLPYQEAASFSLRPSLVFRAFLPPLSWDAPFSEFIAYVGWSGLALGALGAWTVLRRGAATRLARGPRPASRQGGIAAASLLVLGVTLAFGAYNPLYYLLYKIVPGFDLFRVPARWLLLYAAGAAMLAGIGAEALPNNRRWRPALMLLLTAELFVAGRGLAYNRPTAPAAFESLRSAPAHLLAAGEAEIARFLSLSDILYDPGDLEDLQTAFAPYLGEQAIYDLVVAAKMKEVLAYNLPLLYRLSSVDGYDGGLLPTARFVALEQLFLPAQEIWPDGRLRQQLRSVPPPRLLALLNVRHVVTDKLQDIWLDGIYYDLEHSVELGAAQLVDLPSFQATDVGLVTHLRGAASLQDGTPVARIVVTSTTGAVFTATLNAGRDSAEGLYDAQSVAHRQPQPVHKWRSDDRGSDYLSRVSLPAPTRPQAIAVHSLLPALPQAKVVLCGLTLVDSRTGTHRSVSVEPAYRLVHSGDVKIYEHLASLPRAYVVLRSRIIPDDEVALAALREPGLDPAREVVLASGQALSGQGETPPVHILSYEPERVELQVSMPSAGYLILADADYPGWTAEANGRPLTIERANVYFRAVYLESGVNHVVFRFNPPTVRLGLWLGAVAWLVWLVSVMYLLVRIGRRAENRL